MVDVDDPVGEHRVVPEVDEHLAPLHRIAELVGERRVEPQLVPDAQAGEMLLEKLRLESQVEL